MIHHLMPSKTQIILYILESDFIKHFVHYKTQIILYVSTFIFCGLADSLSAIYMMENLGIMRESNSIVRFIVLNHGFDTFLVFKIWATTVLLSIILFTQYVTDEQMKCASNGLLIALSLGGIFATISNIMTVLNGNPPYDSYTVIAVYLLASVLLITIGEWMDEKHNHCQKNKSKISV